MYADDLQLYCDFNLNDKYRTTELNNQDLDRILNWRSMDFFNPQKCSCILFDAPLKIQINGFGLARAIMLVKQVRNLALFMDSFLNFKPYVSELLRRTFIRY